MTDEHEIAGTEADMEDSRIYEAAFHIVPSLDEAGAAAEVADIKKFLVSNGASILGSGEPMLMTLAYEVQKDIERKRHTFTRAYFAWFVFEATPEAAHAAKEMLGTRPNLVRSLLMKTSEEAATDRRHPALLATPSDDAPVAQEAVADDVSSDLSAEASAKAGASAKEEEKKPMDVEKVDAEIAKLVVE
jgi:ribosomal protein S6